MSSTTDLAALDAALFGVDWDASLCEEWLRALAAFPEGSPDRTNGLVRAIDAFGSARDSLVAAELFAAKLMKGGRRG